MWITGCQFEFLKTSFMLTYLHFLFLARLASSNEGSFANVAWFCSTALGQALVRSLWSTWQKSDMNISRIIWINHWMNPAYTHTFSAYWWITQHQSRGKTKVVVLMFLTLSHSTLSSWSSIGLAKKFEFSLGWYGNTQVSFSANPNR